MLMGSCAFFFGVGARAHGSVRFGGEACVLIPFGSFCVQFPEACSV